MNILNTVAINEYGGIPAIEMMLHLMANYFLAREEMEEKLEKGLDVK